MSKCRRTLLLLLCALLLPACPPDAKLGPRAAFHVETTRGSAPLRVQFRDRSESAGLPITKWAWEFGDGHSSSEQHPVHRYTRPGRYTVALTVTNAQGKDRKSLARCVNVRSPEIEGCAEASAVVGAEGGTLSLDDGSAFEIPAQALDQETEVTVSVYQEPGAPASARYVRLQPEGLRLKKPAKVTLAPVPGAPADSFYQVVFPEQPQHSGEKKLDLGVSMAGSVVGAGALMFFVAVFKTLAVIHSEPVYVVPYLPGKYLLPGDVVFAMDLKTEDPTEGLSWIPGHSALFLGAQGPTFDIGGAYVNDGRTIMESLPAGIHIRPWFDPWDPNGFQFIYYHLYMGARRYRGPMTNADRKSICEYAVAQKDARWGYVEQGNFHTKYFSCVGLLEASYDHAGKSTIPWYWELPVIYPKEMYDRTDPIHEISAPFPETLRFPVYGTLINHAELFRTTYELIDAEVLGMTAGMRFEDDVFTFDPPAPGAYTVTLRAEGDFNGNHYQADLPFTLHSTATR